jgi:hypothetical protein
LYPSHGADLAYLYPLLFPPVDDIDANLAGMMLSMWANFASTGNPDLGLYPGASGYSWYPYTLTEDNMLVISDNIPFHQKTGIRRIACEMWEKVNYLH